MEWAGRGGMTSAHLAHLAIVTKRLEIRIKVIIPTQCEIFLWIFEDFYFFGKGWPLTVKRVFLRFTAKRLDMEKSHTPPPYHFPMGSDSVTALVFNKSCYLLVTDRISSYRMIG